MKDPYKAHFKKSATAKNSQDNNRQSRTGKSFRSSTAIKSDSQKAELELRKALGLVKTSPKRKQTVDPVWISVMGLSAFGFAIGLYFSYWGTDSIDLPVNVSVFGPAEAQDGEEKDASRKVGKEEKKTGDQRPTPAPGDESWTEEELKVFANLNERKQELDQRAAELKKLEDELQSQREEIGKKLEELEKIRSEISHVLKDRMEQDEQKVKKLVDVYSNMKPQNAAKVFENINKDLAVEVLGKMKKAKAAKILNKMDPEVARELSEMFTGYQDG